MREVPGRLVGGPAAGRLLSAAAADALPPVVEVVGPGGSGKTWLLEQVAELLGNSGRRVLTGAGSPVGGGSRTVLVVDDADRLAPGAVAGLVACAAASGTCTLVAHRPGPAGPGLARLLAGLSGARRVVRLGHLPRGEVARWLAAELGRAPEHLVDAVLDATGGLPVLVARHVAALAGGAGSRHGNVVASLGPAPRAVRAPHRGVVSRSGPLPHRGGVPPDGETVPDAVRAAVGQLVAGLDEPVARVLQAVAAGAPWDVELLAELLFADGAVLRADLDRARASGLVGPDGALPGPVRAALLVTCPGGLTTELRRRLLRLLDDRGGLALPVARLLAGDRSPDRLAAGLLTAEAAAVLTDDPAEARRLLGEAAAVGADAADVAALQAEAAALTGDVAEALRWADDVTRRSRDGTDEHAVRRAAGVSGVLLAGRGLPLRSAGLFRRAGADRAGAAALQLLLAGRRSEAEELVASGAPEHPPEAQAAAERLVAVAVLQSLDGNAPVARALTTLAQAAALVEPVGRTTLLADTPAGVAAVLALSIGDATHAAAVLRRADRSGTGGRLAQPRHGLLAAWTAMVAGRLGEAEQGLYAVERAAGVLGEGTPLEPRDELFRRTLHLGLARRRGDLAGQLAAWEPAREAWVRYPVDLLTLLPAGELIAAGARLRRLDVVDDLRRQGAELLGALGEPAVWSAGWHWSGVQAAILAERPGDLEPHAAALVAAARTSPVAGVLAGAGHTWLAVLHGTATTAQVVAAADALGAAGWTWEGSRLAGHAAARAREAADRGALLQCARTLSGPPEPAQPPAPAAEPVPSGRLSAREREVAELVVAGVTYREIGSRLFISAKTVEHHVARMRQRLGAADRTELLAHLRVELRGAA
ncbi:LuxR C-terminal-related transcriptional regulator [uncultured Modestobacter sp.]|uniref:helix-turn-helix transcriptional regulator n=1 Tax=uncultured Modestobacter sp. TaxID=380048 RepID=UPI00260366F5|nr:LuxR C-terminal-related transcriptional regulator [uncultured Modestobacter sp.]